MPHRAQEALSYERTPTLSYSLPFFHAVVEEWKHLKGVYPLLSPYIEIGIRKVEEYINKSKHSQTYLLAVCQSPFLFYTAHIFTPWLLVLNPCLKMNWIQENCSVDGIQKTKRVALDAVGPV